MFKAIIDLRFTLATSACLILCRTYYFHLSCMAWLLCTTIEAFRSRILGFFKLEYSFMYVSSLKFTDAPEPCRLLIPMRNGPLYFTILWLLITQMLLGKLQVFDA